MSEEERQRTIRTKVARMSSASGPALPTGFAELDRVLGIGGLPRGRIVEIFGPSSCGKTTLALQIAAHAQASGGAAAWIDADHTFDAGYAAKLAVDIERMPVGVPESAEEALEVTRQLAASGAVDLVVVDPAAALVPRIELATALGVSSPGMQGRVLIAGLRKLETAATRSGVVILFLNQSRAEGNTSVGGPGLKLHAAVRMIFEEAGRHGVRFRTVKSKVGAAFAAGELQWADGVGFAKHA